MDTSDINDAKAFTDAIKKLSADSCRKIDNETEEIRNQRLSAMKDDAEKKYNDFVTYETGRIKNEKNRLVSSLEEDAKRQLTEKRNGLMQQVFDKVKENITAYTRSSSYTDYIISSAKEIAAAFPDGEIEFFVKPDDIDKAAIIEAAIGHKAVVSQSSDIIFGGIRAIEHNQDCLADCTLDLRLENQKEWFFKQSGLKI